MSVLGELEAAGAALLVEGLKVLAESTWRSVTGTTDAEADRKAIAKIKAKAENAAIKAALEETQRLADQAGFVLSTVDLGLAAERMRSALTDEAIEAQRTVPKLEGLDIEIVPPGTLSDEEDTKP